MLQIRHNSGSQSAQRHLAVASRRSQVSARNLASGESIHTAADNAAGIAVKTTFTASLRGKRQALRNTNEAVNMLQTAESGVAKISELFSRARELSVQSANDTNGKSQRILIDKEYQDVIDEVERIFKTTEYNGQLLLDDGLGTFNPDAMTFQVGSESTTGSQLSLDLNFSKIRGRFDNVAAGGDLNLVKVAAPLINIDLFDKQLSVLNAQRTQLGSNINRLSAAAEQLSLAISNESDSLSRVADTDMGKESTDFARHRVLMDTGIAMLGQANTNPNAALHLLR